MSTDTFNPYAAPKTAANLLATNLQQISYDGESLMIPKHFVFPPVCLKTGAVSDLTPQRRRKLSWYPPLLGLLIILNLLIFAIVAACVSKKGEIYFQLSSEVARKRRNALLRNWGIFALGIVCIPLAVVNRSTIFGLLATACILTALILGLVASRFLWAKRIDATHIWLRGVPDEVARALVASYTP
jgi:hypothetical protein